ncbi:iron-hydroxamate ABC transporter substrate-binding protein [Alkalihalobacillus oceani]|uniref:iron-hydroxamate ABC transporter substrate-binding protein n=1 Tax=Halalkalibacter oceani TaxID=1653776 RepID=UPI00203CFB07|nr:iron-hydroxamate ABC transporter substrate-binding protein [Halalkalibacter oceani]MCM3760384.1 iron-hydroxamate ABC transporter substrate-binding protein [Halalkalibacter oceani]
MKRIIQLALFMLLTMLVVACGSDDTEQPQAADEDALENPAADSNMRSFETVKGSVEIPSEPQRIVTDYYGGELLAVGGNVVGVEPTTFDNPFLTDYLTETVEVGYPVNAEKTLELQPDLIVVMYDDNYEDLAKIAPTIHIPYGTATNIEETVKLFADIVGNEEHGEQFLEEFEQAAAEGRERLAGVIEEDATFGLYELTDKGDLWVFGENAGRAGQAVYHALGLKMQEKIKAEVEKSGTGQISLEVLPEYAADYMFLTTYDPEKKGEALAELQSSAVWNSLDAVQNETLFYNDFDTFYRYDPIAVKGQIDLIVEMLLDTAQ